MSSGPNHRRGHGRIQDRGPTFEGGPPCSGCNSTHVAKARKGWKDIAARSERRTGKVTPKFRGGRGRPLPETEIEE